ncbi:PREDICTED: uncharacterized protein LOC106815637 [Priapulus caudatus]|uniref:Uncharacterized protein LOC106815637 n=1 Tax=Priapulus caudatus TaxID=37621 RepID=A0ABM1ETU2_PRICU|nr:PREDICTED: uncharacterized protein LOC106815637 [Priapulus caudatus]
MVEDKEIKRVVKAQKKVDKGVALRALVTRGLPAPAATNARRSSIDKAIASFQRDIGAPLSIEGTVSLLKKLKCTAVPHVFPWNSRCSSSSREQMERVSGRQRATQMHLELKDTQRFNALSVLGAEDDVVESNMDNLADSGDRSSTDEGVSAHAVDVATQSTESCSYSARKFLFDDKGMQFYTGLDSYKKIELVLNTLGPAAYSLYYFNDTLPSLSVPDHFFLTLVKLRRHTTDFELSRLFEISEKSVANICVTWINFMAVEWDEIDWWPVKELVKYYMPSDFKMKFPATRVILDGTECPIMKPADALAQQATFSSYKNRNTVKVVVGASPGGLVSYVSPAYGGSTSDRQVVERSNLMKIYDSGDSVMVDKGFSVQDLFVSSNVTINIPTFFKKRNRLSCATVINDRKIASKRVYIERIIGLAKTYKILREPMNNTEFALSSKILKVCFYLCNFRANIVPKDA